MTAAKERETYELYGVITCGRCRQHIDPQKPHDCPALAEFQQPQQVPRSRNSPA